MPPLPVCSGAEVIRALARIGYVVARTRGSHTRLTCSGRPPVTVPLHSELDRGTLRSILRQAQLTPSNSSSFSDLILHLGLEYLFVSQRPLQRWLHLHFAQLGDGDVETAHRLRTGSGMDCIVKPSAERLATVAGISQKDILVRTVKIVVEKHDDGYVAYPLGIEGAVVGEGETFDEALADVKSALAVYVETFGPEALDAAGDVREAFISEAGVGT